MEPPLPTAKRLPADAEPPAPPDSGAVPTPPPAPASAVNGDQAPPPPPVAKADTAKDKLPRAKAVTPKAPDSAAAKPRKTPASATSTSRAPATAAAPVTPDAPSPPDESPLEKFLERAAPILAVERGINARSRVRLMAVARDVGLPDGEFEPAVRLLQRAPAQSESPADQATEPFRRYFYAKLEQSTLTTITPTLEQRVVAVAIDKFKLTDEQARHAIGQVAAERGVKRFSQQDCEDYMNNLVAERLLDSEWLDDESVNRLRTAGAQWGLSIEQVDALIVERAAANRQRRDKEENRSKLTITVAVVAGVAVFLVLAVLVIWGNMGGGGTAANGENGEEEEEPEKTPLKPRPKQAPKWWTKDLVVAQVQARTNIADYRPVYDLLCAEEPEERAKGYEQLVGRAQGGSGESAARDMLRQVVAGSYALEPDDATAEKLGAALVALATLDQKKLPPNPEAYDRHIWAVETALAAIYKHAEGDKRAGDLAAALGKALGTTLDRTQPRPVVERRIYAALAGAFYRQLTAAAASSPALARELHVRLIEWSQDYIKLEDLESLDAGVLAAVLPAAGEAWRDFLPLIDASLGSKDPLVVLKMLEVYEKAKSASLQDYLADLLVLRTRAKPKSSSRTDVAAAVRKSLGAVIPAAPTTVLDRWQTLKTQAEETLARPAAPTTETVKLLDESLLLAHLATLGCAVAQQEPGFALFDQLAKDGPPAISGKKKGEGDEPDAGPDPIRGVPLLMPTPVQQKELVRFVEGLTKFKDLNTTQRLTYARGLAGLTDRTSEIAPEQGVVIAKYLLGEKPDDEQRRVNDSVETLCKWKSVRLALADLLADPANVKIPLPLASDMFGKAARRDPVSTSGEGWAETVREQLLRSVLADLAAAAGSAAEGSAKGIDRAAEALLELYRARAKVLGIGLAQYRTAATPAAALELLATHQAAQLSGASRPADAEYLARLPHELAIVEYLGSNDLRRTVLAQRVSLRLLSMSLARKRPELASQAKTLVDELVARDQKATHLLLQLRDGEATTLRMWLLHAPKE